MVTIGGLRGYDWTLNGLRNWFIKQITIKVSVRNIHITEGWYIKFNQYLPSSLSQGLRLATCNLRAPGFYHGWDNEQYHVAWKLPRCAIKFRMSEADRQTATKKLYLLYPNFLYLYRNSFLSIFIEFRKAIISFTVSVCLSVRPHGTTRLPLVCLSVCPHRTTRLPLVCLSIRPHGTTRLPLVCLSVRPHGTTRLPRKGFSWHLILVHFSKICREISRFILTRIKRELYMRNSIYFWSYLAQLFLSRKCFRQNL